MKQIHDVEYVTSTITGGHYAFKAARSGKVFKNKMSVEMSVPLVESDIVVDIGGYVGEYSLYAARQGVKEVRVYEPTPRTFDVLKLNTTDIKNITAHNYAVVGDDTKEVNLFLSEGIGVTNSIVKTKKNTITVPAIRYDDIVKDATVVKIDVEGAEYGFDIIKDNLRAIILEVHSITGVDWRTKTDTIIKNIQAAGFTTIIEPMFKHGFDMHGAWIRK